MTVVSIVPALTENDMIAVKAIVTNNNILINFMADNSR